MLLAPQHSGQMRYRARLRAALFFSVAKSRRQPATRATDADLNIEIKMEFVGMRTQRDGIDLLFSLIV